MLGLDSDQTLRLVYLAALLAFVVGGLGYRRRFGRGSLPALMIWIAAGFVLVAVYAYRGPLLRLAEPVLAELDPSRVIQRTGEGGSDEFAIRRGQDGHFHLDADVNGASVRFLVDTGASSTVLTIADAERAGIETAGLEFDRPVDTANGVAFSARTTLRTLSIGPYRLSSVPARVMRADALSSSLLGMSVIDRFRSWRIEGDRMILSP